MYVTIFLYDLLVLACGCVVARARWARKGGLGAKWEENALVLLICFCFLQTDQLDVIRYIYMYMYMYMFINVCVCVCMCVW